jgi:hypothetical protein
MLNLNIPQGSLPVDLDLGTHDFQDYPSAPPIIEDITASIDYNDRGLPHLGAVLIAGASLIVVAGALVFLTGRLLIQRLRGW